MMGKKPAAKKNVIRTVLDKGDAWNKQRHDIARQIKELKSVVDKADSMSRRDIEKRCQALIKASRKFRAELGRL